MKRIYHPYTEWECVAGGMYEVQAPAPLTPDEAREQCKLFLSNLDRFESALNRVIVEWPISCEHFLSNEHINRIAWLGQSSMCIETKVPACFRGGFRLLKPSQQIAANTMALKYLNIWLRTQGEIESNVALDIADDYEEDSIIPLVDADNSMGTVNRIKHYIETWKNCGYAGGIPDEVPNELMHQLLAPSYKAICFAILKNDMPLKSLGFIPKRSDYYGMLKRMEFQALPPTVLQQLWLFS